LLNTIATASGYAGYDPQRETKIEVFSKFFSKLLDRLKISF